jgi:hypothetical protein
MGQRAGLVFFAQDRDQDEYVYRHATVEKSLLLRGLIPYACIQRQDTPAAPALGLFRKAGWLMGTARGPLFDVAEQKEVRRRLHRRLDRLTESTGPR